MFLNYEEYPRQTIIVSELLQEYPNMAEELSEYSDTDELEILFDMYGDFSVIGLYNGRDLGYY